jgi:hypothetical protein
MPNDGVASWLIELLWPVELPPPAGRGPEIAYLARSGQCARRQQL